MAATSSARLRVQRADKTASRTRGPTPTFVREVCRDLFNLHIGVAASILEDPESKAADKLKALELLAKIGVGTVTNLQDERSSTERGVIALPLLELHSS